MIDKYLNDNEIFMAKERIDSENLEKQIKEIWKKDNKDYEKEKSEMMKQYE